MLENFKVVIDKICEIYVDNGEKMTLVLLELSFEDQRCGSRANSAHWRMLRDLVDQTMVIHKNCLKISCFPSLLRFAGIQKLRRKTC